MACIINYNGRQYSEEQFRQYISNNMPDFSRFMDSGNAYFQLEDNQQMGKSLGALKHLETLKPVSVQNAYIPINESLMQHLQPVMQRLEESGFSPLIIGGAVRDALLGKSPKDIDIEVYNASISDLQELLSEYGRVDEVGKAFGILKFIPFKPGTRELQDLEEPFDFSVPRRENKSGKGYKGFSTEFDNSITIEEASSRRDFTWNSIGYNPVTQTLYDYYGGLSDLKNGIIRHTTDKFAEDPLRILRAMQFQSRMGHKLAKDTAMLIRGMVKDGMLDELPKERIVAEWMKWAVKGSNPQLIFDFLRDTGIGEVYFPELMQMKDTPQDVEYHPEGNVEEHTKQVLEVAVEIANRENLSEEEKAVLIFSALFHDVAKPATTEEQYVEKKGRKVITSRGHEAKGAEMLESILLKMGISKTTASKIIPLVREHLAHATISSLDNDKSKMSAFIKLVDRLDTASVEMLKMLMEADMRGRNNRDKTDIETINLFNELIDKYKKDYGGKVTPLITGKDLMALGLQPGKELGNIVKEALNQQKEMVFSDRKSALEWLSKYLRELGYKIDKYLEDTYFPQLENRMRPQEFVNTLLKTFRKMGTPHAAQIISPARVNELSGKVSDYNKRAGSNAVVMYTDPAGNTRLRVNNDATSNITTSKEAAVSIAEKLKQKFGIDYVLDDTIPAKGMVINGVVHLNPSKMTDDTVWHEFAHPFIASLKENNKALYNNLAREIRAEKRILAQVNGRYREFFQKRGLEGQALEDAIMEEAIVQLLGEYASQFNKVSKRQGLLKAIQDFIRWVSQELNALLSRGSVDIRELDRNLTLKDLAILMNSELNITGIVKNNNAYYQLDQSTLNFYASQLENKTARQKSVAEDLLRQQGLVERKHVGNNKYQYVYTSDSSITFTSTTDMLNEDPYYKYEGDTEKYEINRQWGNTVDRILQEIVLGTPANEIEYDKNMLSEEAFAVLHTTLKKVVNQYPDAVMLTQMIFFNSKQRVAGSADLVLVLPDGTLRILDLKSSIHKVSGAESTYTRHYTRNGVTKSSKKERHEAQLSVYAQMARGMGYTMTLDTPISVVPIHLTVDENNNQIIATELEDYPHTLSILKKYEKFSDVADSQLHKDRFERVMIKVRKLLGHRKDQQQKEGKSTYHTDELVKALEMADTASAVNRFVKDAYETFFGNDGNFKGYYHYFQEIMKNAKENPLEFLNQIRNIENIVSIYAQDNTLNELRVQMQRAVKDGVLEAGSLLEEIREITDVIDLMMQEFKDTVPEAIAEILSTQVSQEHIAVLERNLQKMKDDLKRYKANNIKASQIKAKELQIQREEERLIRDSKGDIDFKAMIVREITLGGYKDISVLDKLLTPAVSIDNTFLPTFALLIKEAFEKVRRIVMGEVEKMHKDFEEFKKATGRNMDRPDQFNEGLYEIRLVSNGKDSEDNYQYKEALSLVAPIDYGRFMEALRKQREAVSKLPIAEQSQQMALWYAANTETRPQEDITLDGVVLIEGMKTIKEKMKSRFFRGEKDPGYQRWLQSNTRLDEAGRVIGIMELAMPRMSVYKSANFEAMTKQPALRKYYVSLVKRYFAAQDRMPSRFDESDKFILPHVPKSSMDRVLENGLKNYGKYSFRDMFNLTEQDTSEATYGSELKGVPVMYFNKDMDAADVSRDIGLSIMKFDAASLRHEQQSKYSILADNLLTYVKKTKPVVTDSSGFKVLSKAAALVGIKDPVEKYMQKHDGNNVAGLLEGFIDVNIYGRTKMKETVSIGPLTFDLGKVADSIISFASKTQIAFKPLLSVANSLQANAMALTEAAAKAYYGPAELALAKKDYLGYTASGDFLRDMTSPYNKTLMGQLIDLYEPMQGNYMDSYGHRLTKSKLKQAWSWNTPFIMQHLGEHEVAVTTMLAALRTKKVKMNGQEIPLLEAYELDGNGKIRLKAGVDMNDLVDSRLQRSMHAVNKRLHGIYNDFDRPLLQRHSYGRLLMLYRNFLAPGFKRRYKAAGMDYELGDMTEGMYRTLYRLMFTEFNTLLKVFSGNSGLSEWERQNVKRALTEHAIIMLTGIIAMVINSLYEGAPDDEEEKKVYAYLLYFSMRLNAEMSVYGAPGDPREAFLPNIREVGSVYMSPTVATGVFVKFTKFYTSVFKDVVNVASGEDIARLERDTGLFEKGDSKTLTALIKLMGLTGQTLHPEEALQILTLQKGASK